MPLKFHTIESEDGHVRFGKSKKLVKKNALAILANTALKLTPIRVDSNEQSVARDLKKMETEKKEKELLTYQMLTPNQKVNQFLINKYTDSFNLTTAAVDRYDNTPQRYDSGMHYEYHVYMPLKEEFNDMRMDNKFIVSPKIMDTKRGDVYHYHIPIYFNPIGSEIRTDYNEKITKGGASENKDGLLWALQELSKALEKNNFLISNDSLSILKSHGFIDDVDNKLKLDITGNVLVEKYLLNIAPNKKHDAISYLNSLEGVRDELYEKEYSKLKIEYEDKLKAVEAEKKKLQEKIEKFEKDKTEKRAEIADLEAQKGHVSHAEVKKIENQIKVAEDQITRENKLVDEATQVIADTEQKIAAAVKAKEEALDGKYFKGKDDTEKKKEATAGIVYQEDKNIYENLLLNDYRAISFVRTGLTKADFQITPLLLINPKEKTFYMVIDKGGATGIMNTTALNDNNQKRIDSYIEAMKNNKLEFIGLGSPEKAYLEKRKIKINSENPYDLTKSTEFLANSPNVDDRINKLLNK